MAKRELSSTLRNLKFMQRAAQKEPKPKVEENEEQKPKLDSSFGASAVPARRCIVIMEGDPHPGALKGRMSFQNFNPSVDKLNEEAANIHQAQVSLSSKDHQNGSITSISDRLNESNTSSPNETEVDHKRKHPEVDMEPPSPSRLQKNGGGDSDGPSSSQSNRKSSYKQQKQERLDWNLLRPPKAQTKRT